MNANHPTTKHTAKHATKPVYNMPAGYPFADTLAKTLLKDYDGRIEDLPKLRILLPTRRACRTLQNSFLRHTGGKPLLLPQLSPLGDVDEDIFALEAAGYGIADEILSLPPAIPPTRRRLLLARTIMALQTVGSGNIDKAIALATSLGTLMDEIHTEGLDIRDLPDLVESEKLSEHWNITIDFLEILSKNWPSILEENGYIDQADRRNRLMTALGDFWLEKPPADPIIAAGSTGSIPAARRLLNIIAGLPQGKIILPGLDQQIDDASWACLDDTHPQFALKTLLDTLDIDRKDVHLWPDCDDCLESRYPHATATIKQRGRLATEMMRPADTSDAWQQLGKADGNIKADLARACQDLRLYTCESPQEEALLIASVIREALENPDKDDDQPQSLNNRTIAVVTPDRHLARRITMACLRWNIVIDDSAGTSLPKTPVGSFAQITANLPQNRYAPAALATLLKHNHFKLGMADHDRLRAITLLEKSCLRGIAPPKGLDGYLSYVETKIANIENSDTVDKRDKLTLSDYQIIRDFLRRFIEASAPMRLTTDGPHPLRALIKAHIATLEHYSRIAAATDDGPNGHDSHNGTPNTPDHDNTPPPSDGTLWQNDDGEAMALFFNDLYEHADTMPDMTLPDYIALLDSLMRTVTLRPRYGMHPRVAILGQMEARLAQSDIVILAGLNEGTWPPEAAIDPWMSRPMRKQFGLTSPEYPIGLAAHDFVQSFCQSCVYLTRAVRENGTPKRPARWLERLDVVMGSYGLSLAANKNDIRLTYARMLDKTQCPATPVGRPAPCPPAAKRPRGMSVTQIERWMKDPYHIYARYILGLETLDEIDEKPSNKELGTFIHDILDRFIAAYPADLPPAAEARTAFLDMARTVLQDHIETPRLWAFWWPRIERIADWFITHEQQWREKARPLLREQRGQAAIPYTDHAANDKTFNISARVDRIDLLHDSGAQTGHRLAVIDYKTGASIAKSHVQNGLSPQLPLTALILKQGGFPDVATEPHLIHPAYIGYWYVKGSRQDGDAQNVTADDMDALIAETQDGLAALVRAFDDDNTPYYSLPRPQIAPPAHYQDYAHLARVKEWSAFDDTDSEGGSS